MNCPACDSPNTSLYYGEYATGVTAPDGGAEYRQSEWIYCHDCRAVEEIYEPTLRA